MADQDPVLVDVFPEEERTSTPEDFDAAMQAVRSCGDGHSPGNSYGGDMPTWPLRLED